MKSALLRGLLRLTAVLPLPVVQAMGAALGRLLVARRSKLWRISRVNLALCYPDRAPDWQREMARRSLIETGKSLLEWGPFWFSSRSRLERWVRAVHGQEQVDAALAEGHGMLIASPHMSAWELSCLYGCTRWPMTVLYKPSRSRAWDTLIRNARERFGARLVPTDGAGVRALYKALARGEVVGILPDQEPGEGNGVFADFFGTPASTMVLLNKLARKRRVPVVFAVMRRLPRGQGYELHYLRAGEAIYDADPALAAAEVNACVERCIALAPEQYMWNYKRFRSLPDGGRRDY